MEAKYRFLAHLSCKHINYLISMCKWMVDLRLEERGKSIKVTFTCWLGKADVLRVSCISSAGFLLGMLRINAA